MKGICRGKLEIELCRMMTQLFLCDQVGRSQFLGSDSNYGVIFRRELFEGA